MEILIANFWNELLKYGPPIIVGVWAWYKFKEQNKLNKELLVQKAELDKNLKNYERQLQEVAEKQKHHNQRRLADFNLYAAKKHERCIELYEKLCHVRNKVLWRNNPLRSLPSFTDYNRDDMIEFLDKYNITRARKAELLALWESNPKDGVRQIYNVMTSQEDVDARIAVIEAVKAHLQADLYLPRVISSEIDKYITQLNELAFLYSEETRQHISGEERQRMNMERKEISTNIEKEFPSIVQRMQKMLIDDSTVSDGQS